MQLFAPLTKADAQRRLVHGTIAAERPDKAGEIFDYTSSKPHFEAWSAEIAKGSGGRSVGNLRAMHGRTAAGKLTELRFDDSARRIEAVAQVVDEDEWRKVEAGVYTGFSIGGRYARRWPDPADPALTRYAAVPSEVSLVDNPCIPGASFEMVKADGTRELREFRAPLSVESADDAPRAEDGDALAKLAESHDALAKAVAALGPALDALAKRVEALEAQPLPPKGVVRAIGKREDAREPALDDDAAEAPADPLALVKRAHRQPQRAFAGVLAKG